MRYGYAHLGRQREGDTAVVRWRGSGADVLLLDPVNFSRYCEGRKPVFFSGGGRYGRAPARLRIPEDGRWYVVADLHGYRTHAKATVEVLGSSEHQSELRDQRPLREEPLAATR